jgi:hypothetical protein
MVLQRAHVVSILKHAIAVGEGFSRLGILSRVLPFPYAAHNRSGFRNLMFLGGLPSFGGSFVFLALCPSCFFPCIPPPPYWVL